MANKDYPVGKAQQQVLDALGMTATGFGDATAKFDQLGIVVASKRDGRKSVPVVSIKQSNWKQNTYGDFDGVDVEISADVLSKLAQWM